MSNDHDEPLLVESSSAERFCILSYSEVYRNAGFRADAMRSGKLA